MRGLPVIPCCVEGAHGCLFASGLFLQRLLGSWEPPNLPKIFAQVKCLHVYIQTNLLFYFTVRPSWNNKGSKRVIPRKDVPFGSLNDASLNFGSHPPPKKKTLKFLVHGE